MFQIFTQYLGFNLLPLETHGQGIRVTSSLMVLWLSTDIPIITRWYLINSSRTCSVFDVTYMVQTFHVPRWIFSFWSLCNLFCNPKSHPGFNQGWSTSHLRHFVTLEGQWGVFSQAQQQVQPSQIGHLRSIENSHWRIFQDLWGIQASPPWQDKTCNENLADFTSDFCKWSKIGKKKMS